MVQLDFMAVLQEWPALLRMLDRRDPSFRE